LPEQNTPWRGNNSSAGRPDLRIAVVTPFVDKQHGTERVLAELLHRLAANHDAEIHLYAQRTRDLPVSSIGKMILSERSETPGIFWHKVSSIPGPHLFQFIWWYFANRFARWRDAKFRGLTPDVLYSPGINAPKVNAITVHIVFHAFYEQVRPELRLFRNPPLRWPRAVHRILYYRLIMALERRIYTKEQVALTAVSQTVADQLKRFFGRDDALVVRNAVDTHQFNEQTRLARRDSARSAFGVSPGKFVFLLIGNDWKKKGLDVLLEALTECTDLPVRLLVVGSDNREPYLRRCEELQLGSRVTFLGPSPDVLQFYAAADAYVGPSLEDAYGLPILESMACALPVIASKAAGASEIISDGENGLLLQNPRDVRTLAELMRRLCTSAEFACALGAAAERRAADESWEAHAQKMYNHLASVAGRGTFENGGCRVRPS
jgi:glycosyltransferase involved in cell wall biosynthesis